MTIWNEYLFKKFQIIYLFLAFQLLLFARQVTHAMDILLAELHRVCLYTKVT